ncbi:RecX family transcriptional regulator [Candidatus Roizmanbacteria bacterium]|nr:RecX family transcriptional regulator [Candidatus Roizmanbacteria bacterium]
MVSNDDLQVLLNYAYFYLKFRPRTKKEVRDYLNKKTEKRHWSRDLVEEAIKDLEQQNVINDKEFVRWFVEQRNISKPKSQFVLKGELLRFGIAKELIDEYFSQHTQPEEELAFHALQSKWRRFQSLSKKERFEKAAAFLSRRGFSFDLIRKTIKDLEGEV